MKTLFKPVNQDIVELASRYPDKIKILEAMFDSETIMYIDYANIRGTYAKRRWSVDLVRMKSLFDSFTCIKKIKFFYGLIDNNPSSEKIHEIVTTNNYEVYTKQVKEIKIPFNISSIPIDSTKYLSEFIRRPLLKELTLRDIEDLNRMLQRLNDAGTSYLMDKKCNFDVEIGMHMLSDNQSRAAKNFVLWSGDSDFEYPIKTLLNAKKRVILFGSRKAIARELDALRPALEVFYINGVRNLLCFDSERTDLTGQ